MDQPAESHIFYTWYMSEGWHWQRPLDLNRDLNEKEYCLKSVFRTVFHECSAFWELTVTRGAEGFGADDFFFM